MSYLLFGLSLDLYFSSNLPFDIITTLSITLQILTILDAVTRQYAPNALCKSRGASPLPHIWFLNRLHVHIAYKIISGWCIILRHGVRGLAANRSVALAFIPPGIRSLMSHTFLLHHCTILSQASLWSDSARGSPQSLETSTPYPTHKRRQKSFGADSPEVVTTGKYTLRIPEIFASVNARFCRPNST